MRVLAGVGHQGAGVGLEQRFFDHAPASVGHERHAEGCQDIDRTGRLGLLEHRPAAGNHDRDPRVLALTGAQLCQALELVEGKMRVAQGDDVHLSIIGRVQFLPTAVQVVTADPDGFQGVGKNL